jgi:O-antigen/teichoic acid export membrane protein/peptidoglycan/xylan/chitin deacetylase (PgdA/CDA1 family)
VWHHERVLERLASRALRALRRRRSVVLGYHGVGPSAQGEDPHFLRIPTERFELQVRLLIEAGFEFTTVADLTERAGGGKPPPGLVALSFDDGMSDNHAVVLPILRELGIPATVYVITGLIGQRNPWFSPGSEARMMTVDELRELDAAGIELGAHTVHHADLSQLGEDDCLREMVESRERLREIVGTPVRTFAYPYCRYGPVALEAAGKAAFEAAVTGEGRGSWSPLEMKRSMITGNDGLPSFVMKLWDLYQPLFESAPGRFFRGATRKIRRRGHATPLSDPATAQPSSAGHQAGERAARNTTVRAAAEIAGKLATFVLFAALTRAVGQKGVGQYVIALAFMQITTLPIGVGTDQYLLRQVARDRANLDRLFFNILALKLALTVPVLTVALLVLNLIGYDTRTREAAYVLTVGLLLTLIGKTFEGVFNGTERGDLLALSLVVQRIVTAVMGLALLAAGYGVVAVAASYSAGSAVGVLTSGLVLRRHIGIPGGKVDRRTWPGLVTTSFPFAIQDVFNLLLFRLDAVILSLLATQAAVGRYGSAYRLLESTLFVAWALEGAFTAMYAYLGRDSDPTVGSVFQRSIKVSLVLLLPVAVPLIVLAEPICVVVFGADFRAAADPLRLLAPVVVIICVVVLSGSLISSRLGPRRLVPIAAMATALNTGLNLALIPSLDDSGSALAMLITEIVFVGFTMRLATREVGGIDWRATFVAPLTAGLAMAGSMLALMQLPLVALAVGAIVYVAVFVMLERRISPADLSFVEGLVRRSLPFASGSR